MIDGTRILIVSENNVLMDNIYNWFKSDISAGVLIIDHVKDVDAGAELLQSNPYDLIFQNGMSVIREIEMYQKNSRLVHFGRTGGNEIYKNNVNINNKNDVSRYIKGKTPFTFWDIVGRVGTILGVLGVIIGVVIWLYQMRWDIDNNKQIQNNVNEQINTDVKELKTDVRIIGSNIQDINTRIKVLVPDNRVK